MLPGDQFGADTLLLESDGTENYYYPAFSPDSNWIAYNRAAQGTSNDNPEAELWLISRDGQTNVRLDAANRGTNHTNSWPRWSPSVGEYSYVAYSSKRDYGRVLTNNAVSQIWISAVDLDVAPGTDPSFPPVWLPGQSMTEGNHTPTWVPRYTPN